MQELPFPGSGDLTGFKIKRSYDTAEENESWCRIRFTKRLRSEREITFRINPPTHIPAPAPGSHERLLQPALAPLSTRRRELSESSAPQMRLERCNREQCLRDHAAPCPGCSKG